jgi:hypothetical protein
MMLDSLRNNNRWKSDNNFKSGSFLNRFANSGIPRLPIPILFSIKEPLELKLGFGWEGKPWEDFVSYKIQLSRDIQQEMLDLLLLGP